MSVLRKYGLGLVVAGRTLLVELFGKRLKASAAAPTDGQVLRYVAADDAWSPGTVSGGGSLPAGTNGGVLAHASSAWASTAAGTARQVLTSNGAAAPTWGQSVLPLRIGATVAAALPADAALGLQWDVRSIVVRGSGNAAWMDVWRVNGGGEWVFGTDDATDCGGAVLLVPASGASLSLRRGSTNHVVINSAGALALGSASFQTTVTGSRIVLQTPIAVHDANASSVVTAATIAHTLSSGSAAAGIGARATLAAHNASGTLTDAVAIDGILTNVGAGTEAGALAISTRTAGGALTERMRVHGTGGVTIGSTAALSTGAGLANNVYLWGRNAADSAWAQMLGLTSANAVALGSSSFGTVVEGSFVTLQHSSSSSVQFATAGGARFTYLGFIFASSGVERVARIHPAISQSGTAGYTVLEIDLGTPTSGSGTKRSLSVVRGGVEQHGLDENGCHVGLRLRRTAVTDAAHTVAGLSAYVDMIGLTAARTVTGPSTPVQAGTVVTITNGDGSANGTKTVTFAPAGGALVNGAATHVGINAAYGSCTYLCDGTNWTVIAKV